MNFEFTQEPEALLRRIKLRKKFPLASPFELVVGLDCDRLDPKPEPRCYIQDTIINGKIGYSISQKQLSYEGSYPIPFLGNFEVYANYDFSPEPRRRYNVGFRLGTSGVVSLMHKGEMDVSFKAPFNRRLGFEVNGSVTRPGLGAEAGGGQFNVGSGALKIHLSEANAVVYI
ncbi:hypothetical protein BSKO_09832 [Bryopsis sp. KO-2023]|nr:hypothetical protein BSKO_09832 [Bryopsis sp. KO-2023]